MFSEKAPEGSRAGHAQNALWTQGSTPSERRAAKSLFLSGNCTTCGGASSHTWPNTNSPCRTSSRHASIMFPGIREGSLESITRHGIPKKKEKPSAHGRVISKTWYCTYDKAD